MTGADMLKEEGRASSLLLQIERKFGPMVDDVRQRVRTGTDTEPEGWLERNLTAQSLKDLFDED